MDAPGSESTLDGAGRPRCRRRTRRLPWVSSQPLGRPVVPGGVDDRGQVAGAAQGAAVVQVCYGPGWSPPLGCAASLPSSSNVQTPGRRPGSGRRPRRSWRACSPVSTKHPAARRSRRGSTRPARRRGRLVDRHGDRAGGPDGEVEHRPLVAGLRHQRDPVAGLDPGRDQPLGQGPTSARKVAAVTSCHWPSSVRRRSMTSSGRRCDPGDHDVGEVGLGGYLGQGGDAEGLHVISLAAAGPARPGRAFMPTVPTRGPYLPPARGFPAGTRRAGRARRWPPATD